jgi:hypothetical protein
MGADGEPAEDQGSSSMEFAQPVPCPQLGLQQSATRLYFPNTTTETTLGTLSAAPGTSMSFSLWFNMQDIGTNYLFRIGSPVASFGNSINVRLSSSGNSINMFLSGVYSSGLTANFGEWNHVVVTTSSSSPYWRCWVNNVEASSPTALPSALNVTATDVAIGSYIPGGSSAKGIINDVALWHTELDTSDVAALYNSGVQGMDVSTVQSANLKGWWKCDDLTTLKDYSGTGNNITVNGTFAAASFPENASGSTIVGDFTLKRRGVSVLNKTEDDNDVIAIIPASADVFPTSQGFTCSVWVRGRKTTGNAYIVATTNGSPTQRYSIFTQNAANLWGAEIPVSAGNQSADAAITYDPNEWACLSFTLDFGTNTVKMYTNGALQTTVVRTLVLPTTFSDVNIGGSGVRHPTITGTTPVALFKVAQRTWSDDEVERNYYSDLRLIKGLANE